MMYRDHDSSVTAKGAAHDGGRVWPLFQGASLLCLTLSLFSCVAQQADLVKLETEFRARIAKLDREKVELAHTLEKANQSITSSQEVLKDLVEARAQIKSELRNLREESLTQLHGDLEEESHRLDLLSEALEKEAHRLDQQFNQGLDDLAQRVVERVDQLKQQNVDLQNQLAASGTDMNQTLDERDNAMRDQLVGFQNSLLQFKDILGQVDTQLAEERNRAMNAELDMQHTFTRQQDALNEQLNLNSQKLKTYLATDVQNTLESIHTALNANERALNDKIDAQAAQLSEIMTRLDRELAALQRTDGQYGTHLEDVVQSLAQFRDALDSVAGKLGKRSDDHTKRLERLEQAQTAPVSQAALTDATVGLQSLRQAVQANRERVNDIARSIDQVRSMIQSMQNGLSSRVDEHEARLIELSNALGRFRQSATPQPGALSSGRQ